MKRLAAGIVAVLISVPFAQAADIGVFGSHWDPDEADDAWGAGASLLAEFAPLELRGTYYSGVKIDGVGEADIIPIDAGVAVNLTRAQAVDLYIGGGGSYYIIDGDKTDIDNEFGWYAMARLEVPLDTGISIFGEVMHRGIDIEDPDADLSGTVFNVGIVFR